MKKEFNAPKMDIELFISEDILTDSGMTQTMNAHSRAAKSLQDKEIQELKIVEFLGS